MYIPFFVLPKTVCKCCKLKVTHKHVYAFNEGCTSWEVGISNTRHVCLNVAHYSFAHHMTSKWAYKISILSIGEPQSKPP